MYKWIRTNSLVSIGPLLDQIQEEFPNPEISDADTTLFIFLKSFILWIFWCRNHSYRDVIYLYMNDLYLGTNLAINSRCDLINANRLLCWITSFWKWPYPELLLDDYDIHSRDRPGLTVNDKEGRGPRRGGFS